MLLFVNKNSNFDESLLIHKEQENLLKKIVQLLLKGSKKTEFHICATYDLISDPHDIYI